MKTISKKSESVYYYSDPVKTPSIEGWYYDLDDEAHKFYGPYETEYDALEAYAQALKDLP